MRPLLIFTPLFAATIATSAQADVTALYRTPNGPVTLERGADGAVRVTLDAGTYLLFRDKRAYLSETRKKKTVVTDLNDIVRKLGPAADLMASNLKASIPAPESRLISTSEMTTVAGLSGRVFTFTTDNPTKPFSMVGTISPNAAEIKTAVDSIYTILSAYAQTAGPNFARDIAPRFIKLLQWSEQTGAVIKVADQLELTALSNAKIPPERFTLAALPRSTSNDAKNFERRVKNAQ